MSARRNAVYVWRHLFSNSHVIIRLAVIFEDEKYWNIYFAYPSYRWKKIKRICKNIL